MSAFVGALIGSRSVSEVQSYLYTKDSIIREIPVFNGKLVVIESDNFNHAQYLADRLSSGLFGARPFVNVEDLNEWIQECV